jgi:hypothetical protein
MTKEELKKVNEYKRLKDMYETATRYNDTNDEAIKIFEKLSKITPEVKAIADACALR